MDYDLREEKGKRQTEALDEAGAFFAFSNEQLSKGQEKGVDYCTLGAGLICPKANAKELMAALDTISKEYIQKRIELEGKDSIILYELNNYETFYTEDLEDAYNAVKEYGFSLEDVNQVYKDNKEEFLDGL